MEDTLPTDQSVYANCLKGLGTWCTRQRNLRFATRYQQLIRVMRGLSKHQRKKHFDMRHWGHRTSCGTTMCAAGFCGVDPWFKRQGFRFTANGSGFTIKYRDKSSWDAIEEFFGLMKGERKEGYAIHRVFNFPETVNEVIEAAKERVAELRVAE